MKKTIILSALIILLSAPSFSQESDSTKKAGDSEKKSRESSKNNDEFQTLFGNNRERGAYGAFSIGYSTVDNEQAVIFGGRFEWIVGHSIGFGFGGSGFINEYHWDNTLQTDVFLTGGYGGLYIEPILLPKFPVHIAFPVLLGAGGISYVTKDMNYHNMIEDSEVFLIAEPGAELEFNVTRHFRIAAGASYKFTTPFNVGTSGTSSSVSPHALENWSYTITFKFGRF